VQGQGGDDVEESKHWIDSKHLAYWEECINTSYQAVDLQTEVVIGSNDSYSNTKLYEVKIWV